MMNLKNLAAGFVFSLVASIQIKATTVTYDGEDANIGAGWRDATVTKAYSVNGSNVYGLDGYFTSTSSADAASTNTAITNALPSYVKKVVDDTQTYSGGAYEAIDNPTATTPYFNGLVYSGTDYVNMAAPGVTDNLLTFTLSSSVTIPSDLRIGIMVDNTDNSGGQNPRPTLSLTDSEGDTASAALGTENGTADWYFFDVSNAVAGDVFNIAETNTSAVANENLQAGLVSFDTVSAPEPSTWVLMGVCGLFLPFVLRRRAVGSSN